jgi:hypothetical protein
MLKIDGGAIPMLTRAHAGIKPPPPFPLIDVDRAPGAERDSADVEVVVLDEPAIGALKVAATGKGGHGPSKRGLAPRSIAHDVG